MKIEANKEFIENLSLHKNADYHNNGDISFAVFKNGLSSM